MDTILRKLSEPTADFRSPVVHSDINQDTKIELDSNIEFGRWCLSTEQEVSFSVKYSPNILNPLNSDLLEYGSLGDNARRLVIIDQVVDTLYGKAVRDYFIYNKVDAKIIPIQATESSKNLETLLSILERMEDFGLMRRNEPVIAIGGGVLLDIAGMAASMFRRGIPYIRVPTTLLGLVDASVGAKVAINHFDRRNRLGAYYPPIAAYLDRSFLISLDRSELSNGLAEIIKMAVIKDFRLFELIEKNADTLLLNKFQVGNTPIEIINRSIQGMIEELEPNLWEKNLERIVDFGHSFSPLVEMSALPELSHGQAVVLDILFSCIISQHRGLMLSSQMTRIFDTVKRCGLPTFHPMFGDPAMLQAALSDTIKHRNGDQNLPIPTAIGHSIFVNDLSENEISLAATTMREMSLRK